MSGRWPKAQRALYSAFLLAYPASFRREYGPRMLQAFPIVSESGAGSAHGCSWATTCRSPSLNSFWRHR
jgi:hypothetical protein